MLLVAPRLKLYVVSEGVVYVEVDAFDALACPRHQSSASCANLCQQRQLQFERFDGVMYSPTALPSRAATGHSIDVEVSVT